MSSLVQTRESVWRSPRRLLLAAAGLVCVGLALAGVFVPGLPTTVFLILASYLFTRSCPWLEERVFSMAVFRPFVPYVRGEREFPRRARIAAVAMMWTAAGASLASLAAADRLPVWLAVTLVGAVAVGTYAVVTWRSGPAPDRETT